MDHGELIKKLLPGHIDAFVKDTIGYLKQKDLENVLARLDDSIKDEQVEESLVQLFEYMDKGDIIAVMATGVHSNQFVETTTYTLSYQLQYPEAYQLVNLVLLENSNGLSIKQFHINDIPDSLDVLNKFTFTGKSLRHFLFFGVTIAYMLFIITAFVVCIRTKNLQTKWLWAIITTIGFCEFIFNWTTGVWEVKPFSFGFKFSSFIQPSPYFPSILGFYVPVGAIIFFIKRTSLIKPEGTDQNNEEMLSDETTSQE
jgi:membrane-bound metal-dependent hydrolase YbcI (DUF457 family)